MANPITYTIPGMALLNQRVEVSNANDDCVFTSCAAIVRALTSNKTITGSQIKAADNNYGAKYTGFASAANLVDTLYRLGVTMSRQGNSTQSGLVTLLRARISGGHPCLVTMPSQWNSATLVRGYNPRTYSGYMHVGVACGLGSGMIRVMNPWGGFWQDGSDSYWAQRLLTGDIWVASPKLASAPMPVTVAPAPKPAPAPTPAPVATTADMTDAEKLAAIAKILNG